MKKLTFEPSYDIDQFDEEKPKDIEFHFFGSNALEWFTHVDFQEVYNWFAVQKPSFSIWFVPKHANTEYQINFGSPQGVDAHWLGTYHPK